MKAYEYDVEQEFKFCKEVDCQIDPLESQKSRREIWLLPANSTYKEPLKPKEGFDVIFDVSAGNWIYKEQPKPQEPTEEEKKENIRAMCSMYINSISWRIERYNTQKELGIETSDTAETYIKILEYMQYLREYDEQAGEWWEKNPLNFEEWKNANLA